ncbi:hypothetical protein AB0K08_13510 [Citricoccus sp. NPDC055426]|uniref:hypothetical protein n=1 Tax=Citricoccus sp. NPDC055426 TaxID=3155536 RepID=UPI00343BD253
MAQPRNVRLVTETALDDALADPDFQDQIKGPVGPAPALAAGTTTQVASGQPAEFSLVQTGEDSYRVDAKIPKGVDGDPAGITDLDNAMASAINTDGSAPNSALKAQIAGTITEQTGVYRFHGMPDNATDNHAALQAFADSLPDGAVLDLGSRNKRYRLNNMVDAGTKTITLKGGTLIQGYNGPILGHTGTFGNINYVSIVESVPHVLGDGSASRVTRLTATGHDLRAGDIVKVIADDLLEAARSATARSGEYQMVQEVDGDHVYLSGQLRQIDAYTQNVRVVRHESGALHFDGLAVAVADEGMGVWSETMIYANGSMAPQWAKLHVESATGPVVEAAGCYAYRARSWDLSNILNEAQFGRYGYGLNDRNSVYGLTHGLMVSYARHGWTTNGLSPDENDTRVWRYGRTAHTVVSDSHALGCTNAPFDTHEEAYGVTFVNCTARGTVFGNQSSGAGFQARGKNHRYINCHVEDSSVGFAVLSSYAGDTEAPEYINCSTNGVTWSSFTANRASGHDRRIPRIKIDGGNFRSERHFMTGYDVQARIGGNATIAPKLNGTNLEGAFHLNDCDIRLDGVLFDYTGVTGTSSVLARFEDTANPGNWAFRGRNIEIIGGALMAAMFRSIGGASAPLDATDRVVMDNVRMDTPVATGGTVTGAVVTRTVESTGEVTGLQPPHIVQVNAHATPSFSRSFNAPSMNMDLPGGWQLVGGEGTSGGTGGAQIEWDLVLAKGTYQMRLFFYGDTDGGIATPLLGSAPIPGAPGINTYLAFPSPWNTSQTITIPYSGLHRFGFRSMFKDSASSGYMLRIGGYSLTKIS